MVKSMTGYGKSTGEINLKKITVEIKSLNSKQVDTSIRIPSFYKEKELSIRSLLNNNLQRGKIEFGLYVELPSEQTNSTLNRELFKRYHNELSEITKELGEENNTDLISIISKMPDIMKLEKVELDENEWIEIKKIIEEALININQFRSDEGIILKKELSQRIANISKLLESVSNYEQARIDIVRERIQKHLNETIGEDSLNKDRFEQELIYYLEKYDISEEKSRLSTHLNYFLRTMESSNSEGKKMGFISQEIGREINTLGSKANHADLQKIVVQMKDELEKIKEQILNIL